MSPGAADTEGRVVTSQVRPQNAEGRSYNAPTNIPKPIIRFYSGEPEVLGVSCGDKCNIDPEILGTGCGPHQTLTVKACKPLHLTCATQTTQIFVGVLLLSIGIALIIAKATFYDLGIVTLSGIPIWSGILFIISGSLSVSASRKPIAGKITASLVMNIFSSLAAAVGVIMSTLEVTILHIYRTPYMRFCAYYNNDLQCLGTFNPWALRGGLMSYILLLLLLMLCISISTSVFACKTVCRTSFEEVSVVIYQTTTVVPDTPRDGPPDYSPAVTSDLKAQTGSC